MELRQLVHFVAVAEEESFTRAAQRANIVQSALSTSIRQLEEELGAKLFIRSTRHVRLTAAGRAFLEKALLALQALKHGKDAIADITSLRRGKLALGTVQSLPSFIDLPALLETFHHRYPEIEVRLCQGSAIQLIEKVHSGEIELAILPVDEARPGLAIEIVCCDSLVLACAIGHPLAKAATASLLELSEEAFVDFEPAQGTRKLVDRAFAEVGLERRIAFEVSDLNTLVDLVKRGLGIALVPEAIAKVQRDSIAYAPLADVDICWELAVASSGDKSGEHPLEAAAAAFLKLLVDQGAGHRGENASPGELRVIG